VPDRFLEHPRLRRWAWPFTIGVLFALLIATGTLTLVAIRLNNDVSGLRAAGRSAEVGTCYAQARGRPALITILRVIAGAAGDGERVIITRFIDQYEENTPTVEECDMLALERGLRPEDFPAPDPPESGS
jgi:hypothetical protein